MSGIHRVACVAIALLALLLAATTTADELDIVIRGIQDPVLTNVQNRVKPFRITGNARLSNRRLQDLRQNTERRARLAMRPFGYYHPNITGRLETAGDRKWTLELLIDPGPPVLVKNYTIEIQGDGAGLEALQNWKAAWPLTTGQILNQPLWDKLKQTALDLAEDDGYLLASFVQHTMEVDLERKEAFLTLVLDTGEQAVMGEVNFQQGIVKPQVLENLPRFSSGDPYNTWLLERFRIEIWQTGYFTNIEVLEERRLEESPPLVNLTVTMEARPKNTYQGGIGIGSDTGPRLQAVWRRHLISSTGDSFTLGAGWQDHNNEFFIRANYRLPRRTESRQFWTAEALLKQENEDLLIKKDIDDEDSIKLANGNVRDHSLKLGRLRIRAFKRGYQQLFETAYVQYIKESSDFKLEPQFPEQILTDLGLVAEDDVVSQTEQFLSVGIDWDWPVIRGNAFETVGHRHRAWLFTSNEAWGSDRDFSQIYLSSRWNFIRGQRWKFLLRGEVGYSDAEVEDIVIDVNDSNIEVSLSRLPSLHRFKAGGNNSVRGYGFEDLSNNGIGSNNVITASAEVEMKFKKDWSLAAFFDVGNAFNDWDDRDLKRGVGVGIRWYTIAGAIRVDVAQALDLEGHPWRLHFTIGTPLL
jgi:translocation and assembly module TamA